jgi:hypothetical protein
MCADPEKAVALRRASGRRHYLANLSYYRDKRTRQRARLKRFVLAYFAARPAMADLRELVALATAESARTVYLANRPSAAGAALGAEVSRLTGPVPAACPDCAFLLGTVPNQCGPTLLTAIDCLRQGIPFFCHVRSDSVCEGWLVANAGRPHAPPVLCACENLAVVWGPNREPLCATCASSATGK